MRSRHPETRAAAAGFRLSSSAAEGSLVGTFWLLVWLGAAALALIAAVRIRARLRRHVERRPVLDDADVRRIVEAGFFVSDEDEPLDIEQAHEEERRFWEEEEWDEAEEW